MGRVGKLGLRLALAESVPYFSYELKVTRPAKISGPPKRGSEVLA